MTYPPSQRPQCSGLRPSEVGFRISILRDKHLHHRDKYLHTCDVQFIEALFKELKAESIKTNFLGSSHRYNKCEAYSREQKYM